MRVPTLRGVFATAAAAGLLATTVTGAQGPRSAAMVIPRVTGPLPVTSDSRPFLGADHDLPPIDLGKVGYVEEEFLVSGAANVYDWATDGSISVKTANAPYTTRILIRRPAASARFSGAVIVEPLFPARRWDWSMMWGYSHDYFMEHGDAWVGITLPGSVAGLQKFNPIRYSALSFKNPAPAVACTTARGTNAASDIEEGLRWDMLSQVGALLKSSGVGRPLNGFRVQSIYLTTQGGDLTTYLNAIHPHALLESGKPVYDGYVAKAPNNAARINQCAAAPGPDDPRQIVKNAGVPVIAVAAQGEVLATYRTRRPDTDDIADRYRLYEVAGAGHIDRSAYIGFPSMADQTAAGNAQGSAEWPFAAPCDPAIPLIDTPIMSLAFNAAFANLDRWARQGASPPHASRLDIKDGGTAQASLVTDQLGHAIGGLRTPYLEVPTASYATNSPGPGNCREMGSRSSFDTARMAALYGNKKNYAAKVAQVADRLVKEHWLTEGDARRVKAESTAPWR
jgi:hypothetical protein